MPGSPTGTPAVRRLGRSFHIIRGETQDLSTLIESPSGERHRQVLGLCPIAASCIAVDVAMRWSADPDVREIARLVGERGTEIPLDPARNADLARLEVASLDPCAARRESGSGPAKSMCPTCASLLR